MDISSTIISAIISAIALILFFSERSQLRCLEQKNKRLEDIVQQLDEQARIIIKTDLALNKVQEDLDKKITGLYTLHELGKKINSIFNITDLFESIKQPLVFKLGFSKSLIALKDSFSGKVSIKTYVGYSSLEIKTIEEGLNKGAVLSLLLNKGKFVLVNRDLEKIYREDLLIELFETESFLTVPIVAKDDAVGFILMGSASGYSKITEGDAELLSVLASQIGTAIENSMLYTELFNSHHDLERRVKERTKELARLNEELKRLNNAKSNFVNAVAHELRTPLTSIKGYASIISAGKLGKVAPPQKERLDKIDKHATSLAHLVNSLLDIARIESGKVQMNIKELSIKEILNSVADILNPQVKNKNLSLKINIKTSADTLKADPTQLERVFLNLLSNAIKFTPEKGEITVSAKDSGDSVSFSIQDTGIGIPKQDLEKVFEEFFRCDNAQDQKIQGTGLGLSLVKQIIDAHKGAISVESDTGKGATFTFTIPRTGDNSL